MNFKSEFQSFDASTRRQMCPGKPSAATVTIAKDESPPQFSRRGTECQLHADERDEQQHHDGQIKPDRAYRELRNEPS
jgi:hypothetical protein